jgi:hypothetical protein
MVDQMLGGLFGAQDQEDEPARRRRARDFIDRHERGRHHEMSDAEVMQNYRAATSQLSPDEYRQVATEAFRQMSPEQRRELKRYMRQHGGGRLNLPENDDSPEVLAQAAQQAQQENQGGGGLLGFLGLGKSEPKPAPQQAPAQAKSDEGPIDSMFSNPLVKVAVAGLAAVAAKKLTEPRG